jgi:hypothetical protein
MSRWRITSLPGYVSENLPGVGFPQWKVELLRIRNGRPGVWNIRLSAGKFELAVLPGHENHEPSIHELAHNSSDRIIQKAV